METFDTQCAAGTPNDKDSTPVRLSIIIEWANTLLNGTLRAKLLFDILARQWEAIVRHEYPPTLPVEACRFLDRLDSRRRDSRRLRGQSAER